jgi:Putative MetA-pathway of phenol degradation
MQFHRFVRHALTSLTALALLPGAAVAQTAATDTGFSPRQVLIKLTSAAGAGSGVSNIGEAIADLVGLEVSTAPIGSSAGGFTFTFDPATRSFMRAAPSFGPMFGDRAITAGEGRAGIGVNFIHATYDALDGIAIDDGSLRTVVFHGGSAPPVGAATLTITSDTVVMFANLSLNRWFDASLAAPWVTLRLDGTHTIAGQQAIGSATAQGLGDVALRGKIRLYQQRQGGVALGVDLRLPTGDPEAMLGAGVTRTLVSGIWSGTVGPVAPHASFGYEFWSDPFRAFDPLQQAPVDAGKNGTLLQAGVEWAASNRLTVNGEFMLRTIHNGARLAYKDVRLPGNPFGLTTASVASIDPRGLDRASVAGGVKWNIAGTALFTATVLVPMTDAGLVDHLTPVLGLDWGF